ncbi:hypothetical protein BDP27DRAFT_1425132 [Rhodocollybia butyracea]|uniref:Uncharacterized protein n=1 Tax=Rhodocollybia butyracea TaxID=206335 RepID=A0A9P5PKN4_9AGAR|nr:hypothetical protein BDP27DRAFT_1425132 [Rhodocollybia butyracea]
MNFAYQSTSYAGPSKAHGPFDDGKKEKRRKDISGKVGKEISDRRDEQVSRRHYAENINALIGITAGLSTKPDAVPSYNIRLLPTTIERSALLYQYEMEEAYGLERAQTAYEEERSRVEDEWKKGRDRVRERLMEGIEERRRRAREDKEGEGTSADATMDSQSRPHITRKLRNKIGTSPPPTPGAPGSTFPKSYSLSVDEIPSPFPLSLTSTTIPTGGGGTAGNAGTSASTAGGRRRPKGSGTHQSQAIGGLGKSLAMLGSARENEIESDLGEIRRGNKRRRAAVVGSAK